MSGHSKWHSIRHKKAAVDAKRGQLFTKVIRELTMAAKLGGGNPENNPRLRAAIDSAKDVNMPKDNIQRAIKKGTGELPGVTYEEVVYEGYGPGGVAVLVEVTTDNKNRTTAEVRHIFAKFGGNLGESGCVAWMFHRKGVVFVAQNAVDEEKLLEIAINAGAEDVKSEEDNIFEVFTSMEDLNTVRDQIEEAGIEVERSELVQIPVNTIELDESNAGKVLKMLDALEDNDDVNKVWANFDIPDQIMEKLGE